MIPAALFALALVDAAFCGFRNAAGRSFLIDKRAFFWRALARGSAAGLLALALIGATVAAALLAAPDPAVHYQAYESAGGIMLLWYAPYATVVLVALAFFYGSSTPEWRALATTIVLGPLTLIRPFIIVGGALHALAKLPPWPIAASILTAAIVMPPLGRFQNALHRRATALVAPRVSR